MGRLSASSVRSLDSTTTTPATPPRLDPDGRRVLYVGADLATSASEVFGEAGVAAICPRYRVSILTPTAPLPLFDLTKAGAAMAIGALPTLADGNETRALTQQWARAIFEDQPAGRTVRGVRYRSAYNFGHSIAPWDCDDRVDIVRDSAGRTQDHALDQPRIFGRFQVEMGKRRISVTTVRLFHIAHHDGLQPTQHVVVCSLPPRGWLRRAKPSSPAQHHVKKLYLQQNSLPRSWHT